MYILGELYCLHMPSVGVEKPSTWDGTLTNQAAHKLPTLWPSVYVHEYLYLGNFGIRVVQVLYLIMYTPSASL